jgi:hypothetical protein
VGIVEHALIRYLERVKQVCVGELFERILTRIFCPPGVSRQQPEKNYPVDSEYFLQRLHDSLQAL